MVSAPSAFSGSDVFFSHPRSVFHADYDFPTGLNKYHRIAAALVSTPRTIKEQNNLVTKLENLGIMRKHDLVYLFAQNDASAEAFSLLNLVNADTFRASKNASPTYGVNGWTFPSSPNYLATPFSLRFDTSISGLNWQLNSCSISVWIATYPTVGSDFVGPAFHSGARILFGKNTATSTYNELFSGDVSVTSTTGAEAAWDFITVSRIGQTRFLYKNGSLISAVRTTGAVLINSSAPLLIGASVQLAYPANMVNAATFLGGHLSLQEHQNLYRELMQYKTSIGL